MVDELYDGLIIPEPMVITVVLKVHVDNIQAIPHLIEELIKERRERKKRKHWSSTEKEAMKKDKRKSLERNQDWQVRVQEMNAGVGSSRLAVIYAERGSDTDPSINGATIADTISIAEGLQMIIVGPNLRTHMRMLYELAP